MNEITKFEKLPFIEMMDMAKAFAESGMFADTKQAAQCIVKIQAGQEIGIPPFAAMTGIHIIMGKPVVGAGIIASRIKASGKYNYTVLQQDENACSIDFYEGNKKIGNSTFTIQDAKKMGTKNIDKFPKNMLFARCISNGSKWFCPDVFTGPVYVEGEIIDAPFEVVPNRESEPPPPPMTDNDKLYRTATGDVELISTLIHEATDHQLLKTFQAVNDKFFKSNGEMNDKLKDKYSELKKLAAETKAA
jgi:hypothetical protein